MQGSSHCFVQRLIAWNRRWSARLDARLEDKSLRVDGCKDFARVLMECLRPGMSVLDVGGGKGPAIPLDIKTSYRLMVVGLDISQAELDAAPPGCYDRILCCDICRACSLPETDLVVSRAVTQHVKEPAVMYENVFRALKPGGITLNFMPNKFAFFALFNATIPNGISKPLLNYFYPESKEGQGFPAFYRNCYPSGMAALMRQIGFIDIEFRFYYRSEYLSFFLPFHFFELGWQLLTSRLRLPSLCETFIVSARRPS